MVLCYDSPSSLDMSLPKSDQHRDRENLEKGTLTPMTHFKVIVTFNPMLIKTITFSLMDGQEIGFQTLLWYRKSTVYTTPLDLFTAAPS